jgi:diadenosine tetraphosphatase ApaH/serine/threonine PP2A family protein phosphatase
MRIAVFSDIHANREALEAFCVHAANQRIDRYMCLGDVVGYGADPEYCISLLRSLPAVDCILGNHDHAVAGAPYSMGREAQKVIEWTRKQLSAESLRFLKSLEASRNWGDMLFCHANPYRPLEWYYVEEREYIARSFSRSRAKSLFIGHTHVAAAITRRNFFCIHINTPLHNTVVPVAELNRQIFNCGSIGQPRDGDPRASYLIYDTDRQIIEFFRLDYDHERAAQKIREAGLPEIFAERLRTGR